MKRLIFASAAAALLGATAALAQPAQPAPQRQFAAKVQTRADVQNRVARMFARLDANRDGFVTEAEVSALRAQRVEKRGARNAGAGNATAQRMDRGGAFERIDANRDGQISRQEWDARRQQTAMRARGIGGRHMRGAGFGLGARMFGMADLDKDSRVSLAEAQQTALQHFDRLDLNRDGQLAPQERQQAWQQLRAQRQQR